jgi:FSR family fosmidomycin resistance protein-like MFS transporter
VLSVRFLFKNPFGISPVFSRLVRRMLPGMVGVLLAVEFADEFEFGLREAAWPVIRTDLNMSYLLVGLVLGLPGVVTGPVEFVIGILGDTKHRMSIMVVGGVVFSVAILLMAVSVNGWMLLGATILFFPASFAIVGLGNGTLIDANPGRAEQVMARWTFAGSAGIVVGSLVFAAAVETGVSWRILFSAVGVGSLLLTVLFARRVKVTKGRGRSARWRLVRLGMIAAVRSMGQRGPRRWLVLLGFSDMMTDILLGFLALYFVDVLGVSVAQAAVAVVVWSVVGLIGDFAIIPLLERVDGLRYLRINAAIMVFVFAGFLLVPWYLAAVVVLGVLGFMNAGWYAILQAQLYQSMPGRSGRVSAVASLAYTGWAFVPLGVGALAAVIGLGAAMWVLLVGPVVVFLGLSSFSSGRH